MTAILQNYNLMSAILLTTGTVLAAFAAIYYHSMRLGGFKRSVRVNNQVRSSMAFTKERKEDRDKVHHEEDNGDNEEPVGSEETTNLTFMGSSTQREHESTHHADEFGEEFAEEVRQDMVERSEKSFPEDKIVWDKNDDLSKTEEPKEAETKAKASVARIKKPADRTGKEKKLARLNRNMGIFFAIDAALLLMLIFQKDPVRK